MKDWPMFVTIKVSATQPLDPAGNRLCVPTGDQDQRGSTSTFRYLIADETAAPRAARMSACPHTPFRNSSDSRYACAA